MVSCVEAGTQLEVPRHMKAPMGSSLHVSTATDDAELHAQALMMAGSFTGPALGGVLADALSVRCDHLEAHRTQKCYQSELIKRACQMM